MRTYEVVYIAAPNTTEEELNKLNSQLENVATELGGKVTKIDVWGRRKLAYKIDKFDEGIYVVFYIEGTGKEISEIERRLRVSDLVIRHLTVRTDQELKRAAKLKSRRRVAAAGSRSLPEGENETEASTDEDEGDEEFDS